jgi:hypothetical protein
MLRHVIETVLADAKFESFYIVGSYARGDQRPDSDIDILLILKSPILVPRLTGLRPVYELRKHGLSANFFGRYAFRGVDKGRSSPFIPLLWRWRKDAVLVAGKDLLPHASLKVDSASYAIYACRCIRWFLYQITASKSGFGLDNQSARWVVKQADRMIEDSKVISGIPSSWGQAWSEVKKEALKARPDPRVMCAALAVALESIKPSIRSTRLYQTFYVLVSFISHGKIRWRTLFEKVPIRIRLVEAMALLMRSAGEEEPDARLIGDAAKLMGDHTDVSRINDVYLKWKKLRDAVCENLETVMMLGFEDAI